ncbi:MAG TPA: RidA family protein [Burkholderiaceae bacterium]|nr:RidA family protein [Burkholderiaceae bacterium]
MSLRDVIFNQQAVVLGYSFDDEIKIGGNYVPLIQHENCIYISGQIPRVGNEVVVTGAAGGDVTLALAQTAAQIATMRAMALLQRYLGSLDKVKSILRLTVYVQSSLTFTQQSEVADGASNLLYRIFGDDGRHTRTSVGVHQLPKNATVEIDMVVAA